MVILGQMRNGTVQARRVWGLGTSRFGYTGRARRGLREAERVARAVASPHCRPGAVVVRALWWEKVKNFGDLLTPYLLRELGIVPVLTSVEDADLVGVGSLVQHLPSDYGGTLWGCGLIMDRAYPLPAATCLALRGELTRDRLGSPQVDALGDPGLLVSERVRRVGICHDVGLVPHYAHRDDPRLAGLVTGHGSGVTVIDVQARPQTVARRIASCRVIVTTSLHGLVVADSFGIPAVWLRLSKSLYGGDFKYRDHETVARPSRTRGLDLEEVDSLSSAMTAAVPADETSVTRARERLTAAARRIPEVTEHVVLPPWQVVRRAWGRPVHEDM